MAKIVNELGTISVSNDVVATIAGMAAMETFGVVGMVGKKATDGIREMLGRDNISRGVIVDNSDERLTINLYIVARYGIPLSQIGSSLVSAVKYTIETMIGVSVDNVNVLIQDIRV